MDLISTIAEQSIRKPLVATLAIASFAENYFNDLRMVDKNETFAYSRIQQVSFGTKADLSVYPNPTTTSLTLSRRVNGAVKIYNLSGQQILQTEVKTEKTQIPLGGLPAGAYVIKSDDGWNSKFIKN